MIPRTAYIDYIGGMFEAHFYDNDEGRNYRWRKSNLHDIRTLLRSFFLGVEYKIVLTEEADMFAGLQQQYGC